MILFLKQLSKIITVLQKQKPNLRGDYRNSNNKMQKSKCRTSHSTRDTFCIHCTWFLKDRELEMTIQFCSGIHEVGIVNSCTFSIIITLELSQGHTCVMTDKLQIPVCGDCSLTQIRLCSDLMKYNRSSMRLQKLFWNQH